MAARRVMHDESSLDYWVIAELKIQMARAGMQRFEAGEADDPAFTVAELADLVPSISAEQLRRRFRWEASIALNDLEELAEALGMEPWALLKAALMRKRMALGLNPGRLRDQVIEGPAGFPTVQ